MSSTAASAKLRTRANVTSTPAGDLLTIGGDIDDNTSLTGFVASLKRSPIIDLGDVTFINSVGVREWITLLGELQQRGLKVTLRNISEPMVRQMTMVIEARGEASVESFYAPYSCPACGDERALLIQVDQHKAALDANKPPTLPCPSCGVDAEFDEFPNRYLSFLT
jgi:anti-anti-sigma regulatory factor